MVAQADAVPIANARNFIPGRPSKSTVWRWVLYGVNGIKLDSFLVGGQRYTSAAMIEKFSRELTAAGGRTKQAADGAQPAPKKPTKPAAARRRRRATTRLANGIGRWRHTRPRPNS